MDPGDQIAKIGYDLECDVPLADVVARALDRRKGEGFLMRVAAEGCALARPRSALENLPRWKPRGSWIRLWEKCAVGWGVRCIMGAAEGAHGAR